MHPSHTGWEDKAGTHQRECHIITDPFTVSFQRFAFSHCPPGSTFVGGYRAAHHGGDLNPSFYASVVRSHLKFDRVFI